MQCMCTFYMCVWRTVLYLYHRTALSLHPLTEHTQVNMTGTGESGKRQGERGESGSGSLTMMQSSITTELSESLLQSLHVGIVLFFCTVLWSDGPPYFFVLYCGPMVRPNRPQMWGC